MIKSEQLNELAASLVSAQAEIKSAKKDSKNLFFKSSYADLSSVWEACKKALTKNGLAVVQTMSSDNAQPMLDTILLHKSGQYIGGTQLLELKERNNPQAMGSAITYARRYGLASLVGVISDEDDDAETAMNRPVKGLVAPQGQKPVASPVVKQEGIVAEVLRQGGEFTFKDMGEAMEYLTKTTNKSSSEIYKLGQVKSGAEVKDPNAFAKVVLQSIKDGMK